MNYNISVYIIFILLMVFIIVFVGRYFYTHGRVFIISLLQGRIALADSINRALLVGYYLLNIGYTFLKLKQWPKIYTPEACIASLSQNIGLLVLILAAMHFGNMLVIYLLSKSNSITHKSFQS